MKVAVSYDKDGNILTLFDPDKMTNKKGTLTYVPDKGERHEVIEVPKEFERKGITELPNLLRVVAKKAGAAKLEAKK
jgi:hypothetical protein